MEKYNVYEDIAKKLTGNNGIDLRSLGHLIAEVKVGICTELVGEELTLDSLAGNIGCAQRDRRKVDLDREFRLWAYIGKTERYVEVCRGKEAAHTLVVAIYTIGELRTERGDSTEVPLV